MGDDASCVKGSLYSGTMPLRNSRASFYAFGESLTFIEQNQIGDTRRLLLLGCVVFKAQMWSLDLN